MSIRQAVLIVLVVALCVAAVQPGRAEAIEPATVLLIAGAGVVVLVLVLYLVIANVESSRHKTQGALDPAPVFVAMAPAPQSP